ncbi:MAG: cytochrome c maturation protein CcmE [Bacteroidetes bacterium]|nr:cytochrome c maturation protein CcmE [Bacteroidota bacterium]
MKPRYIIGIIVIIAGLGFAAYSLNSSKIEYTNLSSAEATGRKVQVKGVWVKEKGADYNNTSNIFSFTMKDDSQKEVKVLFQGARPNNFEIAESIVVKGRFEGGEFHASEVLTKCPSKYEGNVDQLKQSGS